MIGSVSFANPPLKIDNIKPIGRLTYFQSNAEFSYYLPTAFNTDFTCIPQGDKKARCMLNIVNDLSDDESKALEKLGSSNALSDLSYNVVNAIDESIVTSATLPEFQANKVIFTKTLRLSPAPYVMTSFIIPKERLTDFKKAYQTTGLGKYVVKVDMKASDTSFYLSIKNSKTLKEKLTAIEGKDIAFWNLIPTIKGLLTDLEIRSINYEDPKASTVDILKVRYFEKVGIGRYQVRMESVNHISDEEEVYQDDTKEYPYQCEIVTEIKENSVPNTKCESQK